MKVHYFVVPLTVLVSGLWLNGRLPDTAATPPLRQTRRFEGAESAKQCYCDRAPSGVRFPSGKSIPKAHPSEAEAARYGTTGMYAAAPLLAARGDEPLGPHFMAFEFRCPDRSTYCYLRVAVELVTALEDIRSALGGQPVRIHSAYRPPGYNRQVDGALHSAHIDGLAADLQVIGVPSSRLLEVCDQVIGDRGGVGYYPEQGICHIDVRGYRARWTEIGGER